LTSRPSGDTVALVMAALNEAATIEKVLAAIPGTICGLPVSLIVVDDGSTDGTAEVARSCGAAVAVHTRNFGQGKALRTGFAWALQFGAGIVVTMDADGQHDPTDLPSLIGPILHDDADYVQGSRFLGTYEGPAGPRQAGIRAFTALINMLTGAGVTDCTNGFRAIRGSGLARLTLREPRYSACELIIASAGCGLRIKEVPVSIRLREQGFSRKPRGLRYPVGYLAALCRSAVRSRVTRPRQRQVVPNVLGDALS
jgi:glycosyltransferase involved in cell wall biosynthesis